MICEVVRLILRHRSPTPESGNSIKIGLIVYYVCTKCRGLSAFSGELDSLLCCSVLLVWERPEPLMLINDLTVPRSCSFYSPLPLISATHAHWVVSCPPPPTSVNVGPDMHVGPDM